MKKKIDLTKSVIKDVDGNLWKREDLETLIKNIADGLYTKVKTLEMLEVAQTMRKLKPVEVNEDQAKEIKEFAEKSTPFYVHRVIVDLLDVFK